MFFNSIDDDFEGSLFYKFHAEDNGEITDISLKMYGAEIDGVENLKFEYTYEGKTYVNLQIGNESYYFNETDKIIYSSSDSLPAKNILLAFIVGYSKVDFVDSNDVTLLNFATKQDATIKNAEGEDMDTVEFLYNDVDSNDTVTINFNKKIAKIERMYFVMYDGEEIETEVTTYLTEINTSIPDGTFDIPTVEDGYTIYLPGISGGVNGNINGGITLP